MTDCLKECKFSIICYICLMVKQGLQHQLLYGSICLIAFLIPFPYIFGSIALIITTILWLFSGNITTTFSTLKERKFLWPLIIFFLLHAVSYFYSTNKADSQFDLQLKVIFLILPIIIGAGINLDSKWLERILLSFVSGITAVALFTIVRGLIIWNQTQETEQLFYHALVKGLSANAVYVSWYVIFSIMCLLSFPWSDTDNKVKNTLLTIIIGIQFIFLVLLSSRTLILIFGATFGLHILMKRFRFNRKDAFVSLGIVIAVVAILFTRNPIKDRYEQIAHSKAMQVEKDSSENPRFNNLTLRLFIWKAGMDNIKEHNLWLYGSGNGDVHTLQNKKLHENGIKNMYALTYKSDLYNVNLHNMYLQSMFMLGIPGLICFLVLVFSALIMSFRQKDIKIFVFFNIISIIFMMQEAVLQTQAGAIYYCFFLATFWNIHYNKLKYQRY